MKFSHVFLSLLLTSWLNLAHSSTLPATNTASPKAAAADYQPVQGQAGKDVIWIPTPEGLIDKMLTTAKVSSQDKVFDLGAGDGIIAITAARNRSALNTTLTWRNLPGAKLQKRA